MIDKHTLYLALGSNLDDRHGNLRQAWQLLSPAVEISAISRVYETVPAYVLDQPNFLNVAFKGKTELEPTALLTYLKRLENQIGRQKIIRFGPRKIDLDIIFYNDLVLELPHLQIPHPRMAERAFVLRPMMDIASDVVHPVLDRTVAELCADLPADDGILIVFEWGTSA